MFLVSLDLQGEMDYLDQEVCLESLDHKVILVKMALKEK